MTALAAWLKLKHAPLGLAKAHELLAHFGDAAAICGASGRELASFEVNADSIQYLHSNILPPAVSQALQWAQQKNNHIISLADAHYPQLLKTIARAPLLLYVKGHASLLNELQLAIVGSRHPTPAGSECAYAFGKALAEAGLVITSGLAIGIDAASHRGALAANGASIAVMATGLDQIYPAAHRKLAEQLLQHGALVSELPLGTAPRPELFPQRNRIISGLSVGTLVVEAALRSGSLITARNALEQAREVFAIPGSIHNPLARGCHQLIRDGAKLVENVNDILEELTPFIESALQINTPDNSETTAVESLDTDYRQLLEALGYAPCNINELILRCGLKADAVASMLLILELKGYVKQGRDGLYSRLFDH